MRSFKRPNVRLPTLSEGGLGYKKATQHREDREENSEANLSALVTGTATSLRHPREGGGPEVAEVAEFAGFPRSRE